MIKPVATVLLIAMSAIMPLKSLASEPVIVDTTAEVIAYYPQFASIDLVCGTMPIAADEHVIFVCEAAFTHVLLESFDHSNIDGDHVSGGVRYRGAQCEANSGAFTYYDGRWCFIAGDYSAALDSAAAHGGMGFGQALIVRDGEAIMPLWRDGVHQYRALCSRQGRLCVVDSREAVPYAEFVSMLLNYGVDDALYLDMGSGWNHSWWRDAAGSIHEIHPRIEKSRYCTNWLTFLDR